MSKIDSRPTAWSSRTLAPIVAGLAALLLVLLVPRTSHAHCDSMDGPIVPVLRKALESGRLTPALKWVRAEDEETIRSAFERARTVRGRDAAVAELVDLWFLETFVRIHREGEGETYNGLKPAGSIDPVFVAADAALESGSVDELAATIAGAVEQAVRARFHEALERREHAEESVEHGRAYVEAYATYMHFVEGIEAFVRQGGGHPHAARPHAGDEATSEAHHHDG